MLDKVIAGISVSTIVVGLTELVKTTGLPPKTVPWVAIGISLIIGLGDYASQMYPAIAPLLETVIVYLVIGLTATGLYRVGNDWFKK